MKHNKNSNRVQNRSNDLRVSHLNSRLFFKEKKIYVHSACFRPPVTHVRCISITREKAGYVCMCA
jgi:hypothetical protein